MALILSFTKHSGPIHIIKMDCGSRLQLHVISLGLSSVVIQVSVNDTPVFQQRLWPKGEPMNLFSNGEVEVSLCNILNKQARVAITAPDNYKILRDKLYKKEMEND